MLNHMLATYGRVAETLRTQTGLVALHALIGELAERGDTADELRLAVRLIAAASWAADTGDPDDAPLCAVGFDEIETLAESAHTGGWALDVVAAVPGVFALAMPELHTPSGLALLQRFASEVTAL